MEIRFFLFVYVRTILSFKIDGIVWKYFFVVEASYGFFYALK